MRSGWALTPMMVLGLGLGESAPAKDTDPPACLWDPAPGVEAGPKAWEKSWECGERVSALIRSGDDADRERFWSIFDGLPEASPVRARMIGAFLDWHLARALEDLAGAPAASAGLPVVPADAELPEHLKEAPAELQQAWWAFRQATRDDEKARPRPPKGEGIAFQSNEPVFQRAVAGLLRGRTSPADAIGELSRFEWGGWCGTGSESLYMPQSKALMIAYLRLGRIDLATAASAGIGGWTMGPDRDGPAPWDRRLLAAAGIDWERFYLGAVVSGRTSFAEAVAREGSDHAAQQLVTAARLMMGAKEDDGLVWPLAALVERTKSCSSYATGSSREVDRDPGAPPVSGSVQEGVLELLGEKVGPAAGLDEADAASHLLVLLCRPESREAFRAMLGSPYSEVRRRGAIGLRGLGEAAPEPKSSLPVAFRLLAGGKPVAHQPVEWTIHSENAHLSSSAQTDAEGVLRLQRDAFVDPRRPVTGVVLAAREPARLHFEVKLAAPRDLDRLTIVSVSTP